MALDLAKTKYRLLVVDEKGVQRNIKEFVTGLGWEQNPRQLATKISFTVFDEETEDGYISSFAKPGCLVIVTAECDTLKGEVARGYITRWEPSCSTKQKKFDAKCYDETFALMKSQMDFYYKEGTGTEAIVRETLKSFGVPIGSYKGPNVRHDKLAYSTKNAAEIIYDVLDDAAKKGGAHALLRAEKGKVSVIRWGSNKTVWCFLATNAEQTTYSISTENMITRVKVLGEKNDDERSPVEATVDGKTRFGIRQKIYRRGKDESVADAKAAAMEILDNEGDPEEEVTVKAVDMPFIQKGDKVFCQILYANGYFFVKGIKHDAANGIMTMRLTRKESEK